MQRALRRPAAPSLLSAIAGGYVGEGGEGVRGPGPPGVGGAAAEGTCIVLTPCLRTVEEETSLQHDEYRHKFALAHLIQKSSTEGADKNEHEDQACQQARQTRQVRQ